MIVREDKERKPEEAVQSGRVGWDIWDKTSGKELICNSGREPNGHKRDLCLMCVDLGKGLKKKKKKKIGEGNSWSWGGRVGLFRKVLIVNIGKAKFIGKCGQRR